MHGSALMVKLRKLRALPLLRLLRTREQPATEAVAQSSALQTPRSLPRAVCVTGCWGRAVCVCVPCARIKP